MRMFFLSVVVLATGPIRSLAQPVFTRQPTDQVVTNGATTQFSVAVSGAGPFTYQWQFNGTNLPNNIITTVAGNGTNAFSGDGGQATNASLYFPQGVAVDAAGNLYIADNNNDRVRMVDSNGVITTVAGNGVGAEYNQGSFSGDGGAATNAGLYRPNNLAFDAAGDMYIADIFNCRVRKVDTNGIITTVAGNGDENYSGDGGAATNAGIFPACMVLSAAGKMYIADRGNSRIREVDTNGIISTMNVDVFIPQGVALDEFGNLYIADTGNNRILKVDTNGIQTTVMVAPEPWGVTLDASGNLFIAAGSRVQRMDTNGIITTVAGTGISGYSGDGGPATNAELVFPACVALDGLGNLYIADWYGNRIREVHFAGIPTLTLRKVSAANAGTYSVTVTGPSGSVTSSNAVLNVFPPQIALDTTFTAASGLLSITWNAQPNLTYQLQSTTNLAVPVWQNLGNPITATNNEAAAPEIYNGDAQRFYRVEWTR